MLTITSCLSVGRSKVRYVGGWAIRKILDNFVKVNIYRENKKPYRKSINTIACANFWNETSWYPLQNYQKVQKVAETLDVTEARQYRERGLIHISDNTYRFFMAMESERLKLINNHKLTEEKEVLITVAKCTLKNNRSFKQSGLPVFKKMKDQHAR